MNPGSDHGSGSILGLAVVGSLIGLVTLTLPLYMGLIARASVGDAADAAALGAADVASGLAPGSPCATAEQIAAANGSSQIDCRMDGLVITTRENRSFLGVELVATATAGPPLEGVN